MIVLRRYSDRTAAQTRTRLSRLGTYLVVRVWNRMGRYRNLPRLYLRYRRFGRS